MNRHAFRNLTRARAGGPSLSELDTTILSPYFLQTQTASFGTTSAYFADDANDNPFSSKSQDPLAPLFGGDKQKQQGEARPKKLAPHEMSAIEQLRRRKYGPTRFHQSTPSPPTKPGDRAPRIVDIRTLGPPGGSTRDRSGNFRGSLRGRGGARGGGEAGEGGNRFAGSASARGSRFPRPPAGGLRGRGRGGSQRGGAAPKRKGRSPDEEDPNAKNKRKSAIDPLLVQEPEQKEFEDAVKFGTPTQYNPSLGLEDLKLHMPNVPGQSTANVHASLASLGTADPVGLSGEFTPQLFAKDLRTNGLRYFADLEEKDRTDAYLRKKKPFNKNEKGTPAILPAEEAIRQSVFDTAVAGKMEAPKFVEAGKDAVQMSRNWHLRSETWGNKETRLFEEKLVSLLAKGKKGGASKEAAPRK